MSRTQQAKGQDSRADEIRAAQTEPKFAPLILQPNYPRTRARAKLEEQGAAPAPAPSAKGTQASVVRQSKKNPVPKQSKKGQQPAEVSKPRQPQRSPKAIRSASPEKIARNACKSPSVKPRKPRRQDCDSKEHKKRPIVELPSKDSIASEWLERISPLSLECLAEQQVLPPLTEVHLNSATDILASSSITRNATEQDTTTTGNTTARDTTSTGIATERDTTTTTKSRTGNKVTWDKLWQRHAFKEPEDDPDVDYFKSLIFTQIPEYRFRDVPETIKLANDFALHGIGHPNENCYAPIDAFTHAFESVKAEIGYAAVSESDFRFLLAQCVDNNEAFFQREVMPLLFSSVKANPIFRRNYEGQWDQPKSDRLSPIDGDDSMSLPRPDLSLSFDIEAFTGKHMPRAIPSSLQRSLSPDGLPRCFPFLFVEAKRAKEDLESAEMSNVHSASQALYNIYAWMRLAGHEALFFERVRVFSVALNVQDLGLRIHRCGIGGDGSLCFYFTSSHELKVYTKVQATQLMDSVVTNYAANVLRPLLTASFFKVTEQEQERAQKKRNLEGAPDPFPKRARHWEETGEQHTGLASAMDALSTRGPSDIEMSMGSRSDIKMSLGSGGDTEMSLGSGGDIAMSMGSRSDIKMSLGSRSDIEMSMASTSDTKMSTGSGGDIEMSTGSGGDIEMS